MKKNRNDRIEEEREKYKAKKIRRDKIENWLFRDGEQKLRFYFILAILFLVLMDKLILLNPFSNKNEITMFGWRSFFDFIGSPYAIAIGIGILLSAVFVIIDVNIQNHNYYKSMGRNKLMDYCMNDVKTASNTKSESNTHLSDYSKCKKNKNELCKGISLAYDYSKAVNMTNKEVEKMANWLKNQIPYKYTENMDLEIEGCKISSRSRICYHVALINISNKKYGESMHEIHDFIYGFGEKLESEMNELEWLMLSQLVNLILDGGF